MDGELDVELVGVGVGQRVLLQFVYHLRTVLEVGRWVQDLLGLLFLLLPLRLFRFFGCLLCFLGIQFFLLLETFLLVFAEFALVVSCGGFSGLFGGRFFLGDLCWGLWLFSLHDD